MNFSPEELARAASLIARITELERPVVQRRSHSEESSRRELRAKSVEIRRLRAELHYMHGVPVEQENWEFFPVHRADENTPRAPTLHDDAVPDLPLAQTFSLVDDGTGERSDETSANEGPERLRPSILTFR